MPTQLTASSLRALSQNFSSENLPRQLSSSSLLGSLQSVEASSNGPSNNIDNYDKINSLVQLEQDMRNLYSSNLIQGVKHLDNQNNQDNQLLSNRSEWTLDELIDQIRGPSSLKRKRDQVQFKQVQFKDPHQTQLTALHRVNTISKEYMNKELLINNNAFVSALAYCLSSKTPDIQLLACSTLQQLTAHADNKPKIINHYPLMAPIIQALQQQHSPMQAAAISVFASLALHKEDMLAIWSTISTHNSLIKALESASIDVVRRATEIVECLSRSQAVQPLLVQDKGLLARLAPILDGEDQWARQSAFRAIVNLSENANYCEALHQHLGLILTENLGRLDVGTSTLATRVIANIASYKLNKADILKHPNVLINLGLNGITDNLELAREALRALSHLSEEPKNCTAISADMHVSRALCQNMNGSLKSTLETNELAIKTLLNLTKLVARTRSRHRLSLESSGQATETEKTMTLRLAKLNCYLLSYCRFSPQMLSYLSSPIPQFQESAIEWFATVVSSIKTPFVDDTYDQLLKQLSLNLNHPEELMQTKRLKLLYILTDTPTLNTMGQDDALIQKLIQNLSAPNLQVRTIATVVVAKICRLDQNQQLGQKKELVFALCENLKQEQTKLRSASLACLINLSSYPTNQMLISKDPDIWKALINQLNTSTFETLRLSLQVVKNLVSDQDNNEAVRQNPTLRVALSRNLAHDNAEIRRRTHRIILDLNLNTLLTDQRQNTHMTSVNLSASKNAQILHSQFPDVSFKDSNDLYTYIFTLPTSEQALINGHGNQHFKNATAQQWFNHPVHMMYKDQRSNITVKKFLTLFWLASQDETSRESAVSQTQALEALVDALYEIRRGNNLSPSNTPQDDGLDANNICATGTFNKISEKTISVFKNTHLVAATPESVHIKLVGIIQSLIKELQNAEPSNDSLRTQELTREVWERIQNEVMKQLRSEFQEFDHIQGKPFEEYLKEVTDFEVSLQYISL